VWFEGLHPQLFHTLKYVATVNTRMDFDQMISMVLGLKTLLAANFKKMVITQIVRPALPF
jgi:hypothetical protein